MLNKLRKIIHEKNELKKIFFFFFLKKKPRTFGAEKYHSWTGKFTRSVQQQMWSSRRKDETFEITQPDEKKEKEWKRVKKAQGTYRIP